eukprot:612120-Hanusia_phi.AAC.1
MHSDRANTLLRQIKELKSNDATLKSKIAGLEKEVRSGSLRHRADVLQLEAFKKAAAQQPKETAQEDSGTAGKRAAGKDEEARVASSKRHKPSE